MNINRITMIGLGLMGGSIAKAILATYPHVTIKAHARHIDTLKEAYEAGVIVNDSFLSNEELADADLIFLCAPVAMNIDYIKQLAPFLRPTTILTDIGSVKSDIHRAVESLALSQQFIGGHPMTGSEKTGFSHASENLLENAYYILTSFDGKMDSRMEEFSKWICQLGPDVICLSYQEHDRATAGISHLPHLLSSSLVHLVMEEDNAKETMKLLAAGGFRDMTRIAASSPTMWQQICLANKHEILSLLESMQRVLKQVQKNISEEKKDALLRFFSEGKEYRDSLHLPSKGMADSVHECFLDLEDKSGTIAEVATLLAKEKINIKNIGIVQNREFEEGVLRIELYDEKSKLETIACLQPYYTMHIRE